MDTRGSVLHIKEHGQYPYAMSPKALLRHGIHILGPVAINLLHQIRIVATSQEPLEIIYGFISHNRTHHRKINIAPVTSRKWKARGAAVEIIQRIFTPTPRRPAHHITKLHRPG